MEKVTNISSIYTSYTEYTVKKKKKEEGRQIVIQDVCVCSVMLYPL